MISVEWKYIRKQISAFARFNAKYIMLPMAMTVTAVAKSNVRFRNFSFNNNR
jgi:hypothetical protein